MCGVGGSVHGFVERGILVFSAHNVAVYVYDLPQFDILPPAPDLIQCPSLLGRDVLDRWKITYDPSRRALRAQVRSADKTINLKSP